MKFWSRTCGCIHPVFTCGFVCTQLSQQTNWQGGIQDGDLFNEASGEKDREKDRKHRITSRLNISAYFGQQCVGHSS